MRAAFAVVPPMSNAIKSWWPVSRPMWAARMAPAAGPESSERTGNAAAVSAVLQHVEPASEAALLEAGAQGVKVLREPRGDVSIDHRGVGPLVLAVLGRDVRREDHGQARQDLPGQLANRRLVRRIGVRV